MLRLWSDTCWTSLQTVPGYSNQTILQNIVLLSDAYRGFPERGGKHPKAASPRTEIVMWGIGVGRDRDREG